jgi:hypothetical protein
MIGSSSNIEEQAMKTSDFNNFGEFYPFYLSQHLNKTCKVLHFIGTTVILLVIAYIFATKSYKVGFFLPVFGYSFAWTGHYFFEKNRPATFKHPFYSLMGDFKMFFDILFGKIKI